MLTRLFDSIRLARVAGATAAAILSMLVVAKCLAQDAPSLPPERPVGPPGSTVGSPPTAAAAPAKRAMAKKAKSSAKYDVRSEKEESPAAAAAMSDRPRRLVFEKAAATTPAKRASGPQSPASGASGASPKSVEPESTRTGGRGS